MRSGLDELQSCLFGECIEVKQIHSSYFTSIRSVLIAPQKRNSIVGSIVVRVQVSIVSMHTHALSHVTALLLFRHLSTVHGVDDIRRAHVRGAVCALCAYVRRMCPHVREAPESSLSGLRGCLPPLRGRVQKDGEYVNEERLLCKCVQMPDCVFLMQVKSNQNRVCFCDSISRRICFFFCRVRRCIQFFCW